MRGNYGQGPEWKGRDHSFPIFAEGEIAKPFHLMTPALSAVQFFFMPGGYGNSCNFLGREFMPDPKFPRRDRRDPRP